MTAGRRAVHASRIQGTRARGDDERFTYIAGRLRLRWYELTNTCFWIVNIAIAAGVLVLAAPLGKPSLVIAWGTFCALTVGPGILWRRRALRNIAALDGSTRVADIVAPYIACQQEPSTEKRAKFAKLGRDDVMEAMMRLLGMLDVRGRAPLAYRVSKHAFWSVPAVFLGAVFSIGWSTSTGPQWLPSTLGLCIPGVLWVRAIVYAHYAGLIQRRIEYEAGRSGRLHGWAATLRPGALRAPLRHNGTARGRQCERTAMSACP